jgi:RNA 3'-terminal phosphate cyclase (ATP)
MTARVTGSKGGFSAPPGLELMERGRLTRLSGVSGFSNLPGHIGKRQRRQAESLLRAEGFEPEFEIVDAPSRGQGTVLFLVAEFENVCAGFTSLGRKGKPAEKVAEEACHDFLHYHESGAALDQHLADQLVLPLALAQGTSSFSTYRVTQHLLTNVWIVDRFLERGISVEGAVGEAGIVRVAGAVDV